MISFTYSRVDRITSTPRFNPLGCLRIRLQFTPHYSDYAGSLSLLLASSALVPPPSKFTATYESCPLVGYPCQFSPSDLSLLAQLRPKILAPWRPDPHGNHQGRRRRGKRRAEASGPSSGFQPYSMQLRQSRPPLSNMQKWNRRHVVWKDLSLLCLTWFW